MSGAAVTVGTENSEGSIRLTRFAWWSIAAAVLTIALKSGAYLITGSVGLLSDAAESGVNLVAAIVALTALRVAARPADDNHHFGHGKAEYFSAGVEGVMIFVAAALILLAAADRLMRPHELESLGLGLVISTIASVINGVVGVMLLRAGRAHRSAALEADGKHLLTDVWTSAGVIVGVALVWLTGLERLDPVIALVVAANIIRTGTGLVSDSMSGLMDKALPEDELQKVSQVLDGFESDDIRFHALRTRRAGRRTFISIHVLVPGNWSVKQGHDLLEQVEEDLRACFEQTTVFTHLEPIEDPVSFADTGLDRTSNPHTGG